MQKQVFEGIKVADFAWVAVGPLIGRELAMHGATVVRVESHKRPDIFRVGMGPFKNNVVDINGNAFYTCHNTNKYSISLDLGNPKGQEVARRLVKWADIVSDGMTPGTMAGWGLDYESCRQIKPDIIYFSTCQMGQTGPYNKFGGYGVLGAAYSGYLNLLGYANGIPLPTYNNIPDYIAPGYLLTAVIAALIRRKKTGEGMYLDQSQVEAGVNFLAPTILDYVVNGRQAQRQSNRDSYAAPNGVYPCRGDDRWLSLSIENEQEWQAFMMVAGDAEWTMDERFSTLFLRKQNEDELDKLVAAWTVEYTAEQAMQLLQDIGVPAGVVATGEDLHNDPQLKYRQHFRNLEHTVIGSHAYHSPSYRLSETPHNLWKAASCLGEDNFYFYHDILGMSDDEIADLIAEGVITTEADVGEIKQYR